MNYAFEVIMRSEVKLLLDQFASVMKLHTVFYASDGHMLQIGRNENVCSYCQIIQRICGVEKCRMLDRLKQEDCRKTKQLISYRCHAGLGEIMTPVTFSGEVVGFISFGQFRMSDELPALPENANGEERGALKKAFFQLPFFSPEETASLAGLCAILLDYIVTKELVRVEGDDLWEQIKLYLNANFTKKLSLEKLASDMGRSVSTISKLVRSKSGRSFKDLLNGKRLELADRLLKREKQLSIAEVASACGFEDQYYFSRVYRKYRGMCPSASRSAAAADGAKAGKLIS